MTRSKKSPADWWDSFRDECLELQRFAIRILSLTCSSSGCERNWSAFKLVHFKEAKPLSSKENERFGFCNVQFEATREKMRQKQRMQEIEDSLEEIPSDDEWITEKEDLVLPRDNTWLRILDENPKRDTSNEEDVDEIDFIASHLKNTCGEETSRSRGKRKRRSRSIDEIQDGILSDDVTPQVSNEDKNQDDSCDSEFGDDDDHS